MTRIVAGTAKGRRISVPPKGTRPTSDRAREGLFNTLRSELDLDGARVLDLFAGSGAVGLEALSRGADHAVFIEADRDAARVIAANVASLAAGSRTTVHRTSVEAWLASTTEPPFDLVFADPPYAVGNDAVASILTTLIDRNLLISGGIVVIERSSRDPEPPWPAGVTMIKNKRYGEGCLWYGRRESGTES